MSAELRVPIQLGCCPEDSSTPGLWPRCLLCPPPIDPPSPDKVRALIHHYTVERAQPHDHVAVSFFGGAPPPDALLDAVGALPVHVRVRPDLLTRAEAARLASRGVKHIELDALSFDDRILREFGRPYRGRLVDEQIDGLPSLGFTVGVVLGLGLPGQSHHHSVADAERVAGRVVSARLHPVQVFAESGLREAHMDGTYTPLTLGQTITTCRAMLDVLEASGVVVLRIGLQGPADGFGRSVAGPRHSALRQLVEARRTLEHLHDLLVDVVAGAKIALHCAPADETRTRGPHNQHIRTLRAAHELDTLVVVADPTLQRGQWIIQDAEESC